MDEEIQQRTFNHVLELFVHSEIERRKKTGILPDEFVLNAVQILFSENLRKPIIRLNEETKILGEIKLKNDIKKGKSDAVLQNEIERLEKIRLIDEEEPDYAHISIVKFGKQWLLGFDFRYNKRTARAHVKTAEKFYNAAKLAIENKLHAPFIDNLFSCVELLSKAELLLLPNYLKKKTSHKEIQIKYNRFVNMGNAEVDFKSTLNKPSGLRNSARYLKSSFSLSEAETEKYLKTAQVMFDYLRSKTK